MTEVGGPNEVLARAQQRVGKILKGKYRLDRVLGVGGMAAVYAATHRNQSRVAVKMLHLELSFSDEIRTRFLREGYVANTVGHPGALSVIDEDVAEDGAAFLVMELLDGQALDALARAHGGTLSEGVVLAIGEAVLDVLAAAHAKAIVHRDVKPANLFITRSGVLKVLDFGIARLRDASGQESTRTGAMMGTPAFMSPEQAYGRTKEIDAKSDIWAVGASMFQLLTGRHVHSGEGASELLIHAATTPAVSLASVRPETRQGTVAIVDRALAFDKAARWESAAAMRDTIRPLLRESFAGQPSSLHELTALIEDIGEAATCAAPLPFPATSQPWTPSPGSKPGVDLQVTTAQPLVAPAAAMPSDAGTPSPTTQTSRTRTLDPRVVRPALFGVGSAFAVVGVIVALLVATGKTSFRALQRSSASDRSTDSFVTSPPTQRPTTAPLPVAAVPAAVAADTAPHPAAGPVATASSGSSVAPAPGASQAPKGKAESPASRPAARPGPATHAPSAPGSAKASDDDLFHP